MVISIHLTSLTYIYTRKQSLWNSNENKHLRFILLSKLGTILLKKKKIKWEGRMIARWFFLEQVSCHFFSAPRKAMTRLKMWRHWSFKSFWLNHDKWPLSSNQAPRTSTSGTSSHDNIANCVYHPYTRHSWTRVFFLLWWKLEAFPQHTSSNYLQPL